MTNFTLQIVPAMGIKNTIWTACTCWLAIVTLMIVALPSTLAFASRISRLPGELLLFRCSIRILSLRERVKKMTIKCLAVGTVLANLYIVQDTDATRTVLCYVSCP